MNPQISQQTGLDLDGLLKEIKDPALGYPLCLLVNEIGAFCFNQGDKDGKGEKVLLDFLADEDSNVRFAAFCYISIFPEMAKRNSFDLKEFGNNPDNQDLIEKAEEKIRMMKGE